MAFPQRLVEAKKFKCGVAAFFLGLHFGDTALQASQPASHPVNHVPQKVPLTKRLAEKYIDAYLFPTDVDRVKANQLPFIDHDRVNLHSHRACFRQRCRKLRTTTEAATALYTTTARAEEQTTKKLLKQWLLPINDFISFLLAPRLSPGRI